MYLLGIAGGSGSGKTTFAGKILKYLRDHGVDDRGVTLIHQDSYYLPSPPAHLRVHGEPNFDHPDAFDWALLKSQLERLKAGESVAVPVYNFKTSRRAKETEIVGPCETIIVEGIYALWDAEIRSLFDVRVFLNVDSDIRFIRRLHRDVRERGRSLDGIIRQYYDTVRPMHHDHIETTRQYADVVVGEETDIAAEVLASRLLQVLKRPARARGGAKAEAPGSEEEGFI